MDAILKKDGTITEKDCLLDLAFFRIGSSWGVENAVEFACVFAGCRPGKKIGILKVKDIEDLGVTIVERLINCYLIA